jgi:hypothetical protein
MQKAQRLAVPGAALALLVPATAYAGSQQGHYGAAWALTHPKSFHNGGKQSCERKRLQATRKYRECFQEIESAVLTRGLTLQEQEERFEVCAGRLTRDLERASRRAGIRRMCRSGGRG